MSSADRPNPNTRVLVVDDTDHVRSMLADMLELDGFDVVGLAESGERAIDLVDDLHPDVVVMDYRMGGIDGISAARAIRADNPDQPIILYTAYLNEQIEAAARAAGVALCIAKVDGLNRLERHIAELCRDLF